MPKQTAKSPEPVSRRREVLRMLKRATGPMTIADLAHGLEVHPNTVRFHLDTLVEAGQVERVESEKRVPGRPPQLFQVARGMDPTGPRHYRMLAEVLAHSLANDPDPNARAVEAGRAWGRQQGSRSDHGGASGAEDLVEPVPRLLVMLDQMGFAPERRQRKGQVQIGLRHCPFLEVATARPEIVCAVHLGLMQGAMDAWQSQVTVDRLEPFVEPDLCLAHTAPAHTS